MVKFLVDTTQNHRVWLINTRRFENHYEFVRTRSALSNTVPSLRAFNDREYTSPNRRFEMGSIIHYEDSDLWTVELAACDTLSGERIVRLFHRLKRALWIGDQLKFRPCSPLQIANLAKYGEQLPIISTDEVFRGVRYQPLTVGVSYGYLRLVDGELEASSVRPDQILVLRDLPAEVPLCAGVISQPLQAPLGHIAILCANRGTPNMALKGALANDRLRQLDGRLVRLEVQVQEYLVSAARLSDAKKDWQRRAPPRPRLPKLNRRVVDLADLSAVALEDADYAGAKAAQLAEVGRIGGITTPGGFVVPIARYLGHAHASGALQNLDEKLADEEFGGSLPLRTAWLASVRERIEAHPIDFRLLSAVHDRIKEAAPESRWILRSSTNAEDLAGFSGAGLYRSVRINAGASRAELAQAMRKVWASVWLPGAFEERQWYRIDHKRVGMAILVQPFLDAVATGVAITANPFTEIRPGVYINTQAVGGSVTGAAGDEIPEQLLVYDFMGDLDIEIISRSSRTNGEPLLAEPMVRDLAQQLRKIHNHFVPTYRNRGNAVDVEFLTTATQLIILQARPHKTHPQTP
ncbi:MAG: PEP/pyruvate-binding domain-containing protein [Planctomycetota bacterium]